jgi:hypothetical protein
MVHGLSLMSIERQYSVLCKTVFKASGQRFVEFPVTWLASRDMLYVGNLAMIVYLGGKIVEESFSIHFRSSPGQ